MQGFQAAGEHMGSGMIREIWQALYAKVYVMISSGFVVS